MKIAMAGVVLPTTEKAGVAMQVHGLANTLVRRGHDVTVFTLSPAPADARYVTHTFRLAARIPRSLYSFVQAVHLAMTNFSSFDVIHAHGDNYLLFAWPHHIRTFHGSAKAEARAAGRLALRLYYRVMAPLETLGARMSAYNVAVSRNTKASIGRINTVIPCGLELDRFHPGTKSTVPTILFVGGIRGRKRGQLLAECFRNEVQRAHPSAQLWLVSGDSVEGKGIINFGRISDDRLAELYRQAWVFCMPSTYEGFGVPYIEAMASGTPVVATYNVGADEVLEGGRCGVITSDAELGSALRTLLGDAARLADSAERGLKRAQQFDWALVAASYESAYERVYALARQRARRDR